MQAEHSDGAFPERWQCGSAAGGRKWCRHLYRRCSGGQCSRAGGSPDRRSDHEGTARFSSTFKPCTHKSAVSEVGEKRQKLRLWDIYQARFLILFPIVCFRWTTETSEAWCVKMLFSTSWRFLKERKLPFLHRASLKVLDWIKNSCTNSTNAKTFLC